MSTGGGTSHSGPTCAREERLLDMIATGHVDAGVAEATLREVRAAHQRADNTLTLLMPRHEGGPA